MESRSYIDHLMADGKQLYFAAYDDKLHVTVPRDLKQTLPGVADLIIEPPRTEGGALIHGYIDPARPHFINHMKVGNLGIYEILLLCCDDG